MKGSAPCPPLLAALVSALVLLAGPASAHRVSSVSLVCHLDTKGGGYVLDATMEVVPSEEAAVNDQISPEDAAREFAGYLVVMFDEAEQAPDMAIHLEEASDGDTPPELRRQQVLTKLSGKIPGGAKEFLLYLDPRCPMAVVMVVLKDDQPNHRMQVVLAGEYSRPISVVPVEAGNPFELGSAGVSTTAPLPAVPEPPDRSGAFAAGWRAFLHDSALPPLLVVGMLLLTLGRTSVLWQAGVLLAVQGLAFALAVWSLLPAPAWAGQALAGLVAVVAAEAILHRHVEWWRYPLLAAAGAALGVSLSASVSVQALTAGREPTTGQVVSLLLGTEAALVLTALVAAAVLLPLSRFDWYRKSVVVPFAVLVAGGAVFAAVEVYL